MLVALVSVAQLLDAQLLAAPELRSFERSVVAHPGLGLDPKLLMTKFFHEYSIK
jgi:hypothetical protein